MKTMCMILVEASEEPYNQGLCRRIVYTVTRDGLFLKISKNGIKGFGKIMMKTRG